MTYKFEYTHDCNCAKERLLHGGNRTDGFYREPERATYAWLHATCDSDVKYFVIHTFVDSKTVHLLTVHVPLVCSCSVCTPIDNG